MINEKKIRDYFRSVPESVTEVPIFSDEDGTWFAFGHIDPTEMVIAIHSANSFLLEEESELAVNAEDVQYGYAKISKIDDSDPDWDDEVQFVVCKPTDKDAFPISIWNY